jgi:hypothetical protein
MGADHPEDRFVVVHYNAAKPLPMEAKRLLFKWDDEDAKALLALGFKKVDVDAETVMFVDPLAPPLRDLHRQNVLLNALKPGETKRFGDLSPEEQRVVRDTLTPSVIPAFDIDKDTVIGQEAAFQIDFVSGGKTYSEVRRVEFANGGFRGLQPRMSAGPAKPSGLTVDQLRAAGKEIGGSPALAMRFDARLTLSAKQPRVFEACSKALVDFAQAEVTARAEAYKRVSDSLDELNPALKAQPANSWDMGTLPAELREGMKRTFVSGWQLGKFESPEAAATAFDAGRVFRSGYCIALGVYLKHPEPNSPEYGFTQFAFMGRQ